MTVSDNMLSGAWTNIDGLASLWTPGDLQRELSKHLRRLRREKKLSRERLAELCGVPAPTIKRFELTSQISLRQFLILWGALGELDELHECLASRRKKDSGPIEDIFV